MLLKDIVAGAAGSVNSDAHLIAMPGGRALFQAYNGTDSELWVTGGTASSTVKLADIWPGAGSSRPATFMQLDDGRVLFAADNGTQGRELWVTDGTPVGTALFQDIWAGSGSGLPEANSVRSFRQRAGGVQRRVCQWGHWFVGQSTAWWVAPICCKTPTIFH